MAEERGAAPPGRFFRLNRKLSKKIRISHEIPMRPEARQAYDVVSNLKRLCTEFIEGLNHKEEGGRNVNISK